MPARNKHERRPPAFTSNQGESERHTISIEDSWISNEWHNRIKGFCTPYQGPQYRDGTPKW